MTRGTGCNFSFDVDLDKSVNMSRECIEQKHLHQKHIIVSSSFALQNYVFCFVFPILNLAYVYDRIKSNQIKMCTKGWIPVTHIVHLSSYHVHFLTRNSEIKNLKSNHALYMTKRSCDIWYVYHFPYVLLQSWVLWVFVSCQRKLFRKYRLRMLRRYTYI